VNIAAEHDDRRRRRAKAAGAYLLDEVDQPVKRGLKRGPVLEIERPAQPL